MFFGYVQPLVAEYGLYAVFVIVMLESAGVPMPGETALVLASIYAGATGDLNIAQVIAVAAAGPSLATIWASGSAATTACRCSSATAG